MNLAVHIIKLMLTFLQPSGVYSLYVTLSAVASARIYINMSQLYTQPIEAESEKDPVSELPAQTVYNSSCITIATASSAINVYSAKLAPAWIPM